jgi:transposase
VSKKLKYENGGERTISELVVAYWSEKYAKRQMAENKSFLEFIEKLLEHPANFRVTATQSKSIRKYLDKKMLNKKTGEIVNSSELLSMVDMDKLNSFKEGMGYYQIVTSELLMDPKEVIDKYHGLSRIEEQFRIMKGSLSSRPLHVWTREHIKAHLLICAIAVIVMRIIQNRIVDSGLVPSAKDKEVSWTAGLSAERIQRALLKWQVDRMPDDYYRFLSIDDPDLKLILDAFDIQIPYKLFRRGELKGIKTGTQIFI